MPTIRVRTSAGMRRVDVAENATMKDLWNELKVKHALERGGRLLSQQVQGDAGLRYTPMTYGDEVRLRDAGVSHGDLLQLGEDTTAVQPPPPLLAPTVSAASVSTSSVNAFQHDNGVDSNSPVRNSHSEALDPETVAALAAAGFNPDGSEMNGGEIGGSEMGPDPEMLAALDAAGLMPDGSEKVRQPDERKVQQLLGNGRDAEDDDDEDYMSGGEEKYEGRRWRGAGDPRMWPMPPPGVRMPGGSFSGIPGVLPGSFAGGMRRGDGEDEDTKAAIRQSMIDAEQQMAQEQADELDDMNVDPDDHRDIVVGGRRDLREEAALAGMDDNNAQLQEIIRLSIMDAAASGMSEPLVPKLRLCLSCGKEASEENPLTIGDPDPLPCGHHVCDVCRVTAPICPICFEETGNHN